MSSEKLEQFESMFKDEKLGTLTLLSCFFQDVYSTVIFA
jgi:hypothetical protein